MSQTITNLGEIGAVGGMLRPYQFTVLRDGAVWVLTGYDLPELRVWDLRTKAIIAINGSAAITDEPNGVVTYTPGASDPLFASSGQFEGRIWVRPGSGDKEPSGLFRFSIAAGPPPA